MLSKDLNNLLFRYFIEFRYPIGISICSNYPKLNNPKFECSLLIITLYRILFTSIKYVTINTVLIGITPKAQESTIFETLHFIFNSS